MRPSRNATIEPHPNNPRFPLSYEAPKSVCTCRHTGDGPGSKHKATEFGTAGHGACTVKGCGCRKFSWSDWTAKYQVVLDVLRARIKT